MDICVYIINLKERKDRLIHILSQFKEKNEFKVKIKDAIKHDNGGVGLWLTMREIVSEAQVNGLEYVVICEDDHTFTTEYNKKAFFKQIEKAQFYKLDILLGGISWGKEIVKIDKNLFWVKYFSGTQFFIIFRSFFEKFLTSNVTFQHTVDWELSNISENKMVIFPFISVQKEFGYSDATPKNNLVGQVENLFLWTSQKFQFLDLITERLLIKHEYERKSS